MEGWLEHSYSALEQMACRLEELQYVSNESTGDTTATPQYTALQDHGSQHRFGNHPPIQKLSATDVFMCQRTKLSFKGIPFLGVVLAGWERQFKA